MNTSLLIMEFLPLVIYLAIDAWKGFRAGIIAAMICTAVMVAYDYFIFGAIDTFIVGEGVMIIVLGYVSLKMNNDRWFKFQPAVLAAIFACTFSWFQLFDQPLLLHFIPHMEKLLQAESGQLHALDHKLQAVAPGQDSESEALHLLHSQYFHKVLGRMSGHMIWLFIAHGLVMTYAALRLKTSGWFAWRLAIYPGLLILVVINHLLA